MKSRFLKLILSIFMMSSLSMSPAYAEGGGSGIWAALGEYVSRLAGNLDYIEIASDDLGIDDGLIAKVIFGVSRVVERNPESKGDHDRYLVKDKMRIGLRLGAGFVLAGSASYVRQYTLVYPVSKKLQGIFHDKFIVNFLLPFQVGLDKLPPKYVLMTESFIEGQARIKLGGTALIPIGSTTSLGRVQLTRTFIDYKSDKKIKVFRDKAKYTQLAQNINFSLGLIGIPIYEGELNKGNLERKYLEVEINTEEKKRKCDRALKALLSGDDVSELYPLAKIHSLNTKFLESINYFTLAWIFTIEGMDRVDRITERHTQDGRVDYVTRYQVENRRRVAWTLGIDGEVHTSKLWAMARGTGETGYIDPEVRISLIANDEWLKKSELKNTYAKLIDKIAFENNFMEIDSSFTENENEELANKLYMQIDFHLYEEAFEILLNTAEEKYWRALAKVTRKEVAYFKEAAERNYHDVRQRRMRQERIPLRHQYLAKSMKAFIRRIKIAKEERDPLAKMHWLVLALRKLTYVGSESFSPEIFQIIRGLVGSNNIYIRFELINLIDDFRFEKYGPHRVIVKTIGEKRESKNKFHPFFFQDASEIYYLF